MAEKISKPAEPGQLKQTFKRLIKDRIVLGAMIVLAALYFAIAFADFLAPYSESWNDRSMANGPATPVYMMDEDGRPTWPYVFKYEKKYDPMTFSFSYMPSEETYPLQFFTHGEPYKLLGLIPMDIHLFGVKDPARIALLGFDINGRDNYSRMLFGGRVSMTIGFLALFIAVPIGLVYGGIAGYFGGRTDNLLMRFAEIIMSIPSIYLLISLAAILPPGLASSTRFALVTVILAFIGWASLARVIRGMVLSIKSQEFIESARAIGMKPLPIIIKHVLPQTISFVLITITLSVPGYILAESGLSFLGLGIQQPDASWGNMLKEAQDITVIVNRPLMLMPGFLIFLAVLAFNVIGDAVRDILDPKAYARK